MQDEWIKKAFSQMQLNDEKKQQLWENIQQQENGSLAGKKRWFSAKTLIRHVAAACLAVAILVGTGAIVDAATGGKIVSTITQILKGQSSQDIVDQAGQINRQHFDVFAPDIFYMDEQYVLFANLRGVILYDWKAQKTVGTVDLQAIDCIYFDEDTKRTNIYYDGEKLYIFNVNKEIISGTVVESSVYEYTYTDEDGLTFSHEILSDNEKDKIYKSCKKNQKYTYAAARFANKRNVKAIFDGDDFDSKYSDRALKWTDAAGREQISFLYVKKDEYKVYTYDVAADKFVIQPINLEYSETTEEKNPEFVYSGDDQLMAAVVSYEKEQVASEGEVESGTVWVPAVYELKRVKMKNGYLIFAVYGDYTYRQVGTILQCESGSQIPSRFHIKKTDGAYRVVSVDQPRGGSYYEDVIWEMTKDYPGLRAKFLYTENQEKGIAAARKKFLKMYVKDNNLSVAYYKDFGWDAVPLFDQEKRK